MPLGFTDIVEWRIILDEVVALWLEILVTMTELDEVLVSSRGVAATAAELAATVAEETDVAATVTILPVPLLEGSEEASDVVGLPPFSPIKYPQPPNDLPCPRRPMRGPAPPFRPKTLLPQP